MLDYIIVGAGLAGISFSEFLLEEKKSFVVFDNHSQNSTTVAGGLYNPVVLKRFSEVWRAQEQLDLLDGFYGKLEKKLQTTFNFALPVYRRFYSVEEQNNWFLASDKPGLSSFLSTSLITAKFDGIASPFGFGKVNFSGYVDTHLLLTKYHEYLRSNNLLLETPFLYKNVVFYDDHVDYGGLKARHVVFAEGFGLHQNPFFNRLPLDGTKGELLLIKAPKLRLDVIVNTSIFILPLGNDLFKVGATYSWEDKTLATTENGKNELLEKLNEILQCDFEVVNQLAGIRPTVKDRRPLIGRHPKMKNCYVLNGLGTRGVMLGPYLAQHLYQFIENGTPLDPEADITRFKKLNWD
jgi:glycine oxidase